MSYITSSEPLYKPEDVVVGSKIKVEEVYETPHYSKKEWYSGTVMAVNERVSAVQFQETGVWLSLRASRKGQTITIVSHEPPPKYVEGAIYEVSFKGFYDSTNHLRPQIRRRLKTGWSGPGDITSTIVSLADSEADKALAIDAKRVLIADYPGQIDGLRDDQVRHLAHVALDADENRLIKRD